VKLDYTNKLNWIELCAGQPGQCSKETAGVPGLMARPGGEAWWCGLTGPWGEDGGRWRTDRSCVNFVAAEAEGEGGGKGSGPDSGCGRYVWLRLTEKFKSTIQFIFTFRGHLPSFCITPFIYSFPYQSCAYAPNAFIMLFLKFFSLITFTWFFVSYTQYLLLKLHHHWLYYIFYSTLFMEVSYNNLF